MKKFMIAAAALFAVVSMASAVNLGCGEGITALDKDGNAMDGGKAYLVYLGSNGSLDATFNGTSWDMGDDEIVQAADIIPYPASSFSTGFFGDIYKTGSKSAGTKYVIFVTDKGVAADALPTEGYYGISGIYTQTKSEASENEQFDATTAGFSSIMADQTIGGPVPPPIPEPTTYALVGLAAAALALRKRFLKK